MRKATGSREQSYQQPMRPPKKYPRASGKENKAENRSFLVRVGGKLFGAGVFQKDELGIQEPIELLTSEDALAMRKNHPLGAKIYRLEEVK